MTTDQARRILTDARYYRALLQDAMDKVMKQTWDEPQVTQDMLTRRKGVIEGLRIAESFIAEALRAVADEQADQEAEEVGRREAVVPPAMVAAMTEARSVLDGDDGTPESRG